MSQLPELLKNYKEREKEILGELSEKIRGAFYEAQKLQMEKDGEVVNIMTINYLQSSTLTANYELRIGFYNRVPYMEEKGICTYWNPDFITGYLLKDTEYFRNIIVKKIPQIKEYEIQQFIDGYVLNYIFLLQQFLGQILPGICRGMEVSKVIFGEYMGKGTVIMGEVE